ncbi:MAG: hypothetical protein JO214_14055 [Frankiaceae bacterium]|nr:hypothetical protein [Frankiaceae bacterium]
MAKITIEGSLTPSARLARGERRDVQDSDEVRKFVADGFAVVVNEETGEVEAPPAPEPAKPPAKSASRDDWAEFLAEHTDVVTEGRTRDQLVGDYEVWLETHDAPAADED